ncbi:MAG: hypothetical protein IJH32_06025 [Ruminococcus sp.]|nr:hypothetical protein [Ruminococcus sp.]
MLKKILIIAAHITASVMWLFVLLQSESIFSVNVCTAVLSLLALLYLLNHEIRFEKKSDIVGIVILSLAYTASNCLANHYLLAVRSTIVFFLSGFIIGGCIFTALWHYFGHRVPKQNQNAYHPKKVFFLCLVLFAASYLSFLFLFASPGNLTQDSMIQVTQSITGDFTNHHPFWHTVTIMICVRIGSALFHSVNTGVLLYSILQALFMAVSFAYICASIYRISRSKALLTVCAAYFGLMPFNVSYSVSMWKDVPFGICVGVFTVALYRTVRSVGNRKLNYTVLLLSGIGFGIFRSNGLIALAITFFFSLFFLFKKYKKALLMMLIAIVVAAIMTVPVVKLLHVQPVRFTESISIPLQQVSRVVSNGEKLEKDEAELIEKVISLDTVKEKYTPYISDPVKFAITDEGDAYLKEHKADYLKLWFKIGLRHPGTYVKAWVEQTKGYWNSCYRRWRWANEMYENDYGIQKITPEPAVDKMYQDYFNVFKTSFMETFVSIGLYTQFFIFGLIFFLFKRKKETVITLPALANIATLLIATPVYAEFRYAYSLFVCFPILLCALMCINSKAPDNHSYEEKSSNSRRFR